MENRKDIRSLTRKSLQDWLVNCGEKPFRAAQIEEWLWKKNSDSFSEMANLPLFLREKLDAEFYLPVMKIAEMQRSSDGTIKMAFRLHDGFTVEGVLIPSGERMTACISSQVGCSLTCKFCATGFMDRKRNLDAAEIFDQARLIAGVAQSEHGKPLTNIVMMGMGEPLLNYANVMEGIRRITDPCGMGWSPKRITLSTAGIAKMIVKLADDGVKFNLALSLHAADDAKRDQIMPINESNSLSALREAIRYFHQKTRNEITFEYIAFASFNEGQDDADKLARFTKSTGAPVKINILEYNPVEGVNFLRAETGRLEAFKQRLERERLVVNIRRSRGRDIDAACGQLANKQGSGDGRMENLPV
jgi:23S rRNA (adenine2503-C2)-methyltransferase